MAADAQARPFLQFQASCSFSTHTARDAPAPGGYDLAQKRTPYLRMSHTVYLSVHTFESIQYYNNWCFSTNSAPPDCLQYVLQA